TKRGNVNAQQDIINKYNEKIPLESGADICAKCGECEDKCPQQLPIRKFLTRVAWSFKRKE
ncbi:4Fe-4S dicluster domain-containing protein, partial [Candidatus Bathyarchaeota archaeon]|nr:4Fe-4S dicluster domain-containing protein [Candidatus Bathyarchaeota archaeon]